MGSVEEPRSAAASCASRGSKHPALLTEQLAKALARIHALEPGDLEGVLSARTTSARPDHRFGAPARRWKSRCQRSTSAALAARQRPRAAGVASRLVHGDFRLGNFVVSEKGLRAVINWELAHLGDPAEDIGWLCIAPGASATTSCPWQDGTLDAFASACRAAGGAHRSSGSASAIGRSSATSSRQSSAPAAQDHLRGVRRSHGSPWLQRRILRADRRTPAGARSARRIPGRVSRPTAREAAADQETLMPRTSGTVRRSCSKRSRSTCSPTPCEVPLSSASTCSSPRTFAPSSPARSRRGAPTGRTSSSSRRLGRRRRRRPSACPPDRDGLTTASTSSATGSPSTSAASSTSPDRLRGSSSRFFCRIAATRRRCA